MSYLPGHLDAYLERPCTQAPVSDAEHSHEVRTKPARDTRPAPLGPDDEVTEILPGTGATLVTVGTPRPCRACTGLRRAFVNRRGVTVCLECDALPEVPW